MDKHRLWELLGASQQSETFLFQGKRQEAEPFASELQLAGSEFNLY